MKNKKRVWIFIGILMLLAAFSAVNVMGQDVLPEETDQPLVLVFPGDEGVTWYPQTAYAQLNLAISGPAGFYFAQSYAAGELPGLSLVNSAGQMLPEGVYQFEAVLLPPLSAEVEAALAAVDAGDVEGRTAVLQDLQNQGLLPEKMVQNGSFVVENGAVVVGTLGEVESNTTSELDGVTGIDAPMDQLFQDDAIITGSLCVGYDCVNGESFGFDTMRLKENNLRIHFLDTSNTASFPSNDWRIVINDSSNGGGNYFAIEDSSSVRQVFRVDAGAPLNALYVDSFGEVGFGTSNPVADLHMAVGDTPTVRLDQDGSAGWPRQVWDIAGNEANFFIRDVTGGSDLVFRIKPGAPANSFYMDTDGDIGFGDTTPDASLDVYSTDGTGSLIIEEGSGTTAMRTMVDLYNNGPARIRLTNTSTDDVWMLYSNNGGNFSVFKKGGNGAIFTFGADGSLKVGPGGSGLSLDSDGNLTIGGTLQQNGGPSSAALSENAERLVLTQQAEIAQLQQENAELEARLAALEAMVLELAAESSE